MFGNAMKNNNEEIISRLGSLEKQVEALNGAVFGASSTKTPLIKSRKTQKKGKGSTKPVKDLVQGGFFSAGKTGVEVQIALNKRAMRFDVNDIAVTMMRLVQAGLLERDGDGTPKNPWRYKKP